MKKYPSKWYRVQQRGCTPNGVGCLHMDWPLERCDVSPSLTVTRHAIPRDVLQYCLDGSLGYWKTEMISKGHWRVYGRRTDDILVENLVICTGKSERQAMQNLCEEMKVMLP